MRKIVSGTFIATALCCSVSAWAANSGEGQINFTGEIIDSACQVVNGVSSPLDVSLGKVSQTAFTGSGSTTSTTRFDIQLKDCPETITSAAITFGGSADGTNANVLAVTPGTGAATGVGIQLLDKTENPLSLYTASTSYTLQSGTTTNDLVFGVRYIQTGSTITAGPANAVSTFTVMYN
ncbi:fimbrial protein [Leclercia adecarboxylata]|uniref:fimbrial protein n=1 Tax=Leclercia adecarboxylata TaxID=83655 RepID=UPI00254D3D90|nr:fimbrial protein [Leclercia adecarboxylata]MDK4745514.1 fimbrial protein [Leclercia adecarboxylata]